MEERNKQNDDFLLPIDFSTFHFHAVEQINKLHLFSADRLCLV